MKLLLIGLLITSSVAFAGQPETEVTKDGNSISIHLQGSAAKVLYESLDLISSQCPDRIKSGSLASCAHHLNTNIFECFVNLEKDASIPAF